MNTDKMNELLSEVIHIACAAELASDEQIKVQAIGDIYDALSSAMPVDHGTKAKARGEGEVLYKTPKHILDFIAEIANVPFADMTHPAFLKRVAENFHLEPNKTEDEQTGFSKFLKITDNLQLFRFRGADFVKLVGRTTAHDGQPPHCYEIKVSKLERGGIAEARMDDKFLFSIETRSQWLTAEKLSISAMHRFEKERIARNQRKKNRHKRHQAAKREAAGVEVAGREGTPGTGKEG